MKISFIVSSVLGVAMMAYNTGKATLSLTQVDVQKAEIDKRSYERIGRKILHQLPDKDLKDVEKELAELGKFQKFFDSSWIKAINPDNSLPRLEIKPRGSQLMLVRDVYANVLEKLPADAFENTIIGMKIRPGVLGVDIDKESVKKWAAKWGAFSSREDIRCIDFSKETFSKINADLNRSRLGDFLILDRFERVLQHPAIKALAISGVTDISQMQVLVKEEKQRRNTQK